MPNLHRGEIEAEIGGAERRLVLTLGALAELEAAFGTDDLIGLAERFGKGRLKARDLVRVIGAGLRGAGAATVNARSKRGTPPKLPTRPLRPSLAPSRSTTLMSSRRRTSDCHVAPPVTPFKVSPR